MVNCRRISVIGFLLLIPMAAACNAMEASKGKVIENKRVDYIQTQTASDASKTPTLISPTPMPQQTQMPNRLLSSFRTRLFDRDSNRIFNIRLAASKLENHIVERGQVFSFNSVVGKRDADHGFRKAEIIIDGEREEGTGGGVCQLSSTLFNAVQRAGMRTMERHSHSKDVHYVKKGNDAAVDYGNLDFKFMNTLGHAVKLKITVEEKNLEVKILRNND